jgi:hypothetical protein
MDERRITRIQDFIKTSADIETSVIPIINTCIEGMVRASESVSPSEVYIDETSPEITGIPEIPELTKYFFI